MLVQTVIYSVLILDLFLQQIWNRFKSPIINEKAVLYWNTVKITETIEQLKRNGEIITDETLTHISLLLHKHLITTGGRVAKTLIMYNRFI